LVVIVYTLFNSSCIQAKISLLPPRPEGTGEAAKSVSLYLFYKSASWQLLFSTPDYENMFQIMQFLKGRCNKTDSGCVVKYVFEHK